MKLSHSAKKCYLTCPKKWELYYKQKLRSKYVGSALVFGGAIDEALNTMLLEKKKELTKEEQELAELTPEETFLNYFKITRILNNQLDIRKSDKVYYFKSDLDLDLLQAKDHKKVLEFANELGIELKSFGDIEQFLEEVNLSLKAKQRLDTETQRVYNYICWLSLYQKGLLLIDEYRKKIMPEIEEVFEVQKRISLPDGDDEFVGVIDVICSFHSESGIKYVCDNKTSSRPYKQDSVALSAQLAGYSEYEENENCAFIVLEKKLRKREPRVRSAIIKDKMPEETKDETFDELTHVFHEINEGNFEKNMDNCFQYGRKCDYFEYCRTGSLEGLEYKEKK